MIDEILLALMILISLFISLFLPKCSVSEVNKNQKYVLQIEFILTDFHSYRIKLYSDRPYSAISEIKQNRHICTKLEFVEIHYQGKAIILNKSRIISASMEVFKNDIKENKKVHR